MTYNKDAVVTACNELAKRVGPYKGVDTADVIDLILSVATAAFEASLPSESVTLKVRFSAPVNQDGTATIYADGRLECKLNH